MIQEKIIATNVILSIVTCGIFGFVWFIQMTDDTARVSEDKSMSGGTSLLLALVTCGIYYFYWSYKMGKNIYQAKLNKNLNAQDNSVLYLVLSIFGLGIVTYCLIQNELNEIAKTQY